MSTSQAAGLLSVLIATLGLAACGSTDANTGLDNQSANAVGVTLAAQVAGAPTSFTASGIAGGSVGGGFFSPRFQALGRWAAPSLGPNLVNMACNPAVDDPTDTDQDGVPDDANFTFTQANCTTNNRYITGLINIKDVAAAVGYDATFTNLLAYASSQNGNFFSIQMNGTHGVAGTATTGTVTENLVTGVSGKSGSTIVDGTLTNTWTLQFDAATGGTIVMDAGLPDGDFDINGNFIYDINGERFKFSVRTETPLTFDSACALPNPFSAGELRAHLGGPSGTVYVKVTYTGCGTDPTVVLVGRNS